MARQIADTIDDYPEALIPVPLHPNRLRERGFNQALELARPIASQLNIPLAADLCRRVRATPNQTQLAANKRRSNVRRAFEIKTQKLPGHVAIIDDVITTGSTVEELAYRLNRAGVKQVEVWSLARAVVRN
jgi:ComF family protein